ncbi:MAG: tRNA (adenosine(37)-N6)-threonylcarbamoyltransferase complex ATPase subunit type 1 TsaE [Oscillospiraceae bacterium]|nr:tRNA (adenosine(37)-N6)-threonylcarbamoyltransferase complex ATPase subunit type 1 TsaE [Oscillospiraceae bacterium]
MTKPITTRGAGETEALGEALAAKLRPGDAVALFGDLGAGKTAFVRGLAAGLRCEDEVSSPTYALVHEHPGPIPLAHFDMYRVASWEDLASTGYFDYLDQGFVLAIEWSENIEAFLPEACWRVRISPGGTVEERLILIEKSQSEGGAI